MKGLEADILNKFGMIELKREVISILHSLQFDCCYYMEDCIIDLHKLLATLDDMEIPQTNLMKLNRESLDRQVISENLKEKYEISDGRATYLTL